MVSEILNVFFHYKSMETLDPQSGASLDGPQGFDWQDLLKRPLDLATYPIYKLSALWFQRRRFLKFFPL